MANRVTIIRASNAFIYLPLYIAENEKIFTDVQRLDALDKGIPPRVEYTFRSKRAERPGDRNAIVEMLEAANNGDIVFSLGSPLEIVECGEDPRKLVVFGAIVKRPPFWVVNGTPAESIADLKIGKLITYRKETLQTGNYLANFIGRQIGLDEASVVGEVEEVGRELRVLVEKKTDGSDNWAALSVNILGLARAYHKKGPDHCRPILSLTHQPEFQDFVCTAFVTTKHIWDRDRPAIEILLKAMKQAIVMLNSLPSVTTRLCRQQSAKKKFSDQLRFDDESSSNEQLNDKESKWVSDRIILDRIYPSTDLSISRNDWENAARFGRWPNAHRNGDFSKLYDIAVAKGNTLDHIATASIPVRLVGTVSPFAAKAAIEIERINALKLSDYVVVGDFVCYDDISRDWLKNKSASIKRGLRSKNTLPEIFLIWASSGSGKSFFVKQIAADMGGAIEFIDIDLSSITKEDLEAKRLKIESISKPVLVLLDEVDARESESWIYPGIFRALERNTDPVKQGVFVLVGSGGNSKVELRNRILKTEQGIERSRGADMVSRIPDDNQIELPPLTFMDRIAMLSSQIVTIARGAKINIKEIEKLALYCILTNRDLKKPRQYEHIIKQAVARITDPTVSRFRSEDLFDRYNSNGRVFWEQNSTVAVRLQQRYVKITAPAGT